MNARYFLSVAAALVMVGCDQNSGKSTAGKDASGASGNPVDAPADYLHAVANAQKTAVKTVDTAAIQKAIQMFNVDQSRNPKDLNELVEKKYLPKIPEVPAGMKLVYDAEAGTIKVAKQ